jgi:adenine-specific DNA-methyltransferase
MTLKKTILDLLDAEQLRSACAELEVEGDRRSATAMRDGLARAKRAKPERLIEALRVEQIREALGALGKAADGNRAELVARLLEAGGRTGGPAATEPTVDAQPGAKPWSGPSVRDDATAAQYVHDTLAVQRPDAGLQDHFVARKPPKTYRYDSSLDPALSWDEQRERDLGEWLLALITQAAKEGEAAVFAEPAIWKGGGVRIGSISDAVKVLQQISKPFLNWAGKAERHQITVPTSPLFVHERHSTKAILDGIRHRKARMTQSMDLFGDAGLDIRENLEAYEHKGPWQNRMILGDSLSVMNSLLEFEGMAGQVQMIYIDPPYGVKFGSNFQPFVRKRDVKHGGDDDMTREPEMVKAYRDTWELGLHSYLAYLRDRLIIARELLHESGSVFVQISDENLHHVREVLDEVFGSDNAQSLIVFTKTTGLGTKGLPDRCDYILWYARDRFKVKYRQLFLQKNEGEAGASQYDWVHKATGEMRRRQSGEQIEDGDRLFHIGDASAMYTTPHLALPVNLKTGQTVSPPRNRQWQTTQDGMHRLDSVNRLLLIGSSLRYVRYLDDFPVFPLNALWSDTGVSGFGDPKVYVVQTNAKVVMRCMLMCTDPGDVVLDPTCGSGTTAYVSEQWGRRWITIDTSRVPLALARQRLLTATFSYYALKSPQSGPSGGFVYKRKQNRKGEEIGGLVPHVTLKSIANDEPPAMEVLVDRPEEISGVTRVAGPFVVEATIAPVQPLEAADGNAEPVHDAATHIHRLTEVLRQSKTLRLPGNRELKLASVRRTADTEYLHAEAKDGDNRLAIVFGPADGAISSTLVIEASREAYFLKFDRLYFFGFAVEPNARALIDDEKKIKVPAAYVAVTPDVAMSDLLKTTRASEIFSITGLPDISVRRANKKGPEGYPLHEVELKGLDIFDPESMKTESVSGDDVPCWMLDTDYDGRSFYATQVFFPKTSAWDNLQKSLKATFDDSVWEHLSGTVSEPFALGERRRVAVKVIDERGNELMRVLDVAG